MSISKPPCLRRQPAPRWTPIAMTTSVDRPSLMSIDLQRWRTLRAAPAPAMLTAMVPCDATSAMESSLRLRADQHVVVEGRLVVRDVRRRRHPTVDAANHGVIVLEQHRL